MNNSHYSVFEEINALDLFKYGELSIDATSVELAEYVEYCINSDQKFRRFFEESMKEQWETLRGTQVYAFPWLAITYFVVKDPLVLSLAIRNALVDYKKEIIEGSINGNQ